MVTFTQWAPPLGLNLTRKITVNSGCVLNEGGETLDNLFTKCPFARALWFASLLNIRADSIPSIHQWPKMILEDYKADHVRGMSLVQIFIMPQ